MLQYDNLFENSDKEPQPENHLNSADIVATPSKIKIVKPGVDSDLFNQNFIKKNNESNKINILFVGRLEPLKGIENGIRAISELIDMDIKLNIAGGDAEDGETETLKNIALKHFILLN